MRVYGALMDEVYLDAVAEHLIVGEGVEARLSLLPVVLLQPVLCQLLGMCMTIHLCGTALPWELQTCVDLLRHASCSANLDVWQARPILPADALQLIGPPSPC